MSNAATLVFVFKEILVASPEVLTGLMGWEYQPLFSEISGVGFGSIKS